MPGEVIEHVHTLAHGNPAGGKKVILGWRDGSPIPDEQQEDGDDLHDENYYMPSDVDSDSNDDGSYACPDPPHPVAGVEDYHNGQQPHNNDDNNSNDSGSNGDHDDSNSDSDDNSYNDDDKAGSEVETQTKLATKLKTRTTTMIMMTA
jgi:hypothetical protein